MNMEKEKCPKCKKEMVVRNIRSYFYSNYFNVCNNPKCFFYGILRRLDTDEEESHKNG